MIARTLLLTLTATFLAACTMISGPGNESPVKMRERLEIPPDLSRATTSDLSSLPTSNANAKVAASRPQPAARAADMQTIGVRPTGSQARVEREGTQRWLVVHAPPEQVWDILRDYLHRNKGGINIENAKLGYLETEWVEQRYNLGESALARALASLHSTGLRDKFRVRIEPGREPGTTEVMASHIGLEEIVLGTNYNGPSTIWQPRKTDPVLEADLLDRFLIALGSVDPTTRPVRKAESTQQQIVRAARPKGPLVLAGETNDSAWRKVSQALDRAGVQIEDRDRGSGLLFVRYQEQDVKQEKTGITTWLFGNRKKSSNVDDGQDRYQVLVKTDKNGAVVTVLNVEGKVDPLDPVPARLLDTLYEQLL